ncbi:MAG: hypothetical protein JSR54_07045, partial [Proteobacteria bacterium]|nr:hypothetical protein [Pseudomonadota bacterium]
ALAAAVAAAGAHATLAGGAATCGLVIRSGGTVVDATGEGLLRDRGAIAARLLAALAAGAAP